MVLITLGAYTLSWFVGINFIFYFRVGKKKVFIEMEFHGFCCERVLVVVGRRKEMGVYIPMEKTVNMCE